MPPKQVYGKRAVAKPAAAYARFISPRKEEAVCGGESAQDGGARVQEQAGRKALRLGDANANAKRVKTPARARGKEGGKQAGKEVVVDLAREAEEVAVGEGDRRSPEEVLGEEFPGLEPVVVASVYGRCKSLERARKKLGRLDRGRWKEREKTRSNDEGRRAERKEAQSLVVAGELRVPSVDEALGAGVETPAKRTDVARNTRQIPMVVIPKTSGEAVAQMSPKASHTRKPTQPDEDETAALAEQLNGLNISVPARTWDETTQGKKGRRHGSRQTPPRSTAAQRKTDVPKQAQTGEPKPPLDPPDPQSCPTTPVPTRKLKAVAIPKSTALSAMAQLPTPAPIPAPDDPYTSYVAPLLALQSYGNGIIPFQEWSAELEPHFKVAKIAEASFSEVYRLEACNAVGREMRESVLKLVPLRSPPTAPVPSHSRSCRTRNLDAQEKDKEDQGSVWKSSVEDVHSEVKLLQNLNYIPGFTHFRELTILQGRPSTAFKTAWRAWNRSRPRGKKSEFPDPSKKASYDDTQLWAVIEMQDAGTDVEKVMDKGGLSTVWEVWDVFWGVCLSVAKAEEACRFEHRDLHLENICIRSSRSEADADLLHPAIQDPLRRKLGFSGLETTVIDYTLSRADVSSPTSRRSSSSTGASASSASIPSTPPAPPEVAFLDLDKDMALFAGDASEEYQYEIYRYMRGAVLYDDPLRSAPLPASSASDTLRRSPRKTPQHIRFDASPRPHRSAAPPPPPPPDVWRAFHPKTNLVWAHFVLFKLLEHLQGYDPELGTRNVEAAPGERDRVVKKAGKLLKALERVAGLLEPRALAGESGLSGVKELVVLAMEERWLRVGDVAGE